MYIVAKIHIWFLVNPESHLTCPWTEHWRSYQNGEGHGYVALYMGFFFFAVSSWMQIIRQNKCISLLLWLDMITLVWHGFIGPTTSMIWSIVQMYLITPGYKVLKSTVERYKRFSMGSLSYSMMLYLQKPSWYFKNRQLKACIQTSWKHASSCCYFLLGWSSQENQHLESKNQSIWVVGHQWLLYFMDVFFYAIEGKSKTQSQDQLIGTDSLKKCGFQWQYLESLH